MSTVSPKIGTAERLLTELEKRLALSKQNQGGALHNLYLKSIQDIIDRVKNGEYKVEDPSNRLITDLRRVGFFDLASQILMF